MNKIEEQRKSFEDRSNDYYTKRQSENHLVLKDLIWNYFFHDKEYLNKNGMAVLEPMCGYGEGKKSWSVICFATFLIVDLIIVNLW